MQTFLIILVVVLLYANWLWFVAFRAYRREVLKRVRKSGYDEYAYTNDWWLINRDAQIVNPDNMRIAGPFSTAQDAGKCREILELKTKTNINIWVTRLPETAETMEIDHVQPVSKAFNKIRGGNVKS